MHNFFPFSPRETLFKTSVRWKLSTFSFSSFRGKSGLIHQVIHIIHIFYPQFGGLHRFPPKQMFCLFIIIAFFRRFFVQKIIVSFIMKNSTIIWRFIFHTLYALRQKGQRARYATHISLWLAVVKCTCTSACIFLVAITKNRCPV